MTDVLYVCGGLLAVVCVWLLLDWWERKDRS